MKVGSGRQIVDVIKSLVNARSLRFECERVLYEGLFVPILMYGSKIMV